MRVCLFFCLLVLGACGREKEERFKDSIRLSLSQEPRSLDPRKARDLEGMNVVQMLFEGLMRKDKEGHLENALASSVEISEDRRTYRFSLRPSLWSNGDCVVADDFVFAWKQILDPLFPSDLAQYLYPIAGAKEAKQGVIDFERVGIKAVQADLLEVRLEEPLSYFLDLLSLSPFFPVPHRLVLEDLDWTYHGEAFVSNGPFRMGAWEVNERLCLVKNENYWDASSTKLEKVELIITSPDTALRLFEGNKLDWIGSPLGLLPIDAIGAMKEMEFFHRSSFLATSFLRVNTKESFREEVNPLADRAFRRALFFAVDRQAIAHQLLQGGEREGWHLVPPEMGLESSVGGPPMESISFTPKPISLLFTSSEKNRSIAQVIQAQIEQALPVKIELEGLEPKSYFEKVNREEYQLALGSWVADFEDPVSFLEVFANRSNGTNHTGWESGEYLDFLQRSRLSVEERERKVWLSKAEEVLLSEAPIIPLYHFSLNYLKQEGLEDVCLSSLGRLDLRFAHWAF